MDLVVVAGAVAVSATVLVAQVVVGVGLLTRRWLRTALWLGTIMNVAFLVMGAVSPSAFYLVLQLGLLLALREGALDGRVRAPTRGSLVAGVAIALGGAATLPFIATVHPADVMHDPAAVLAFLAGLASGAEALRWLASAAPQGDAGARGGYAGDTGEVGVSRRSLDMLTTTDEAPALVPVDASRSR